MIFLREQCKMYARESLIGEHEGGLKLKKRILSFVIMICMVFSVVPTAAVAAAEGESTAVTSLKAAIDDLLGEPLTKNRYQTVWNMAEAMSDEQQEEFLLLYEETWNRFSNIRQLIEYAEDTKLQISHIPVPNSESVYSAFSEGVASAETAYQVYYSFFGRLRQSGYECLVTANRDLLIENYTDLERARMQLATEEAYYAVETFTVMTDETKEQIARLEAAVIEGEESDFQLSRYGYFNAKEIVDLLSVYHSVLRFEEMADLIPDNLNSVTQLASALNAYDYYNLLREEVQEMIPASYRNKMINAVRISTGAEDVEQAIADIGTVRDAENYAEVAENYDVAYRTYESFVVRYAGVTGVSQLIENLQVLDDQCKVIELIKSIRKLQSAEDITLRSWQVQMESIRRTYDSMPEAQKEQIYNYEDLLYIYQNVSQANAVVKDIESIRNSFTLEDEELIRNTRAAYNALNEQAKKYVGESKLAGLVFAEEQILALNQNVAQRTIQLIQGIGSVTAESRDVIANARASYDALNNAQRGLVSNYNQLTAAETAYRNLDLDLAKASVSGTGTYTYAGLAVVPLLTVRLNGKTLVRDVDYTVSCTSNNKAGTAKIVLQGTGYYTGSVTKTFNIRAASITLASLSGLKSKYTYTGGKIKPSPSLRIGDYVLKKGTDYTISYTANKNTGKAKLTIRGKGGYTGSIVRTFSITKASIKKAKVSLKKKKNLTSAKQISDSVKLTLNGKVLKKNRDYRISCQLNKSKKTATVTVTGKGNLTKTKKIVLKVY